MVGQSICPICIVVAFEVTGTLLINALNLFQGFRVNQTFICHDLFGANANGRDKTDVQCVRLSNKNLLTGASDDDDVITLPQFFDHMTEKREDVICGRNRPVLNHSFAFRLESWVHGKF